MVFDGAGADDEPIRIEDTAAVQAVADPLRIRILKRLGEPASAKELAADLDRPVTSLYHHLDLLEEHGLIKVVDVHKEGRVLVRRYQRRGNRFEAAVERVSFAVRDSGDRERRMRMVLRGPLDPARLPELRRRVQAAVTELLDEDGGPTYEVVITIAPFGDDDEGQR